MNRLAKIPLPLQLAYLECSDCNETFRRGKGGPPESVQTIIITYYQHREEIFANLESLQASQAESSVCPQNGGPG